MSPFEALPDELLLRIFNDNGLQPFELHAIASQSRKLRRVALDDSLWRPICATIVSGCSLLEDDEDIELMKWGARNFYFLWLYLLHQWSPFIGFWVASHSSLSRNIIYIAPSKRRGTIVVAQVLLTSEHIIGYTPFPVSVAISLTNPGTGWESSSKLQKIMEQFSSIGSPWGTLS